MKRPLLFIALVLALLFVLPLSVSARPGSLYHHEAPPIDLSPHLFAQISGGHGTTLNWTASTSAAACSLTATPPCTFGYNVFRGTAGGAEGATPINATLITGTSYFDPVTLTSSPQTFFYTIEAVETVNGVTVNSVPSNEVSATFPGQPAPPTGATGTPK